MTKRPRRSELSPRARGLIAVAGVVQFGLLGAALVDVSRRDADQIRGPRWAWAVASFVNFIGPIAYFTAGRRRSGR